VSGGGEESVSGSSFIDGPPVPTGLMPAAEFSLASTLFSGQRETRYRAISTFHGQLVLLQQTVTHTQFYTEETLSLNLMEHSSFKPVYQQKLNHLLLQLYQFGLLSRCRMSDVFECPSTDYRQICKQPISNNNLAFAFRICGPRGFTIEITYKIPLLTLCQQ